MALNLSNVKNIQQKRDSAIYRDFESYINSPDFEHYMQDRLEGCAHASDESMSIQLFAYVDDDLGGIAILINNDKPFKWYKSFGVEDFSNIFNEKCADEFIDCLENWMHRNKLPFHVLRKELAEFDDDKRKQLEKGARMSQLGLDIDVEYVVYLNEL